MAPLKYYLSIRLQNIHYNSCLSLVNLSFLEREKWRPSITKKIVCIFPHLKSSSMLQMCVLKLVQKMPKLTKATTRKWNTPYAYQVEFGVANVFKLKTIKSCFLMSWDVILQLQCMKITKKVSFDDFRWEWNRRKWSKSHLHSRKRQLPIFLIIWNWP